MKINIIETPSVSCYNLTIKIKLFMKFLCFSILLQLICLFQFSPVFGQGCSDAGFCSMGAMKPDQHFSKKLQVKLRSIEISQYVGRTRFESYIFATSLDVNLGLGQRNTIQFKVPYMRSTGRENWNISGIGDISLSFTRNLINREAFQVNATIGAKIPTNNSDQRIDNNGIPRPVPMYYQTSLGTYDLVLGLSLISRDWLVAFGYQQPLIHNNENQFVHEDWSEHPLFAQIQHYPESPNLRRRSDIMMRVERNFRFSRFSFNVGLLPIYRFRKDRVTFSEEEGEIDAAKSDGLALSLLFGMAYRFSTKSQLKFLFGDRLYERVFNPDGLSREQVFSLGYQINF